MRKGICRVKKIKSIIPIIIYFIFLIVMNVWWMEYYMNEAALAFGIFFYIPYFVGGAFIMCFFLGRLVGKINKDNRVWTWMVYLLILLVLIYFVIWFHEAIRRSHPNFSNIFKQDVQWWYGFTVVDTKIILTETAVGFLLGEIFQNFKEKRKQ